MIIETMVTKTNLMMIIIKNKMTIIKKMYNDYIYISRYENEQINK